MLEPLLLIIYMLPLGQIIHHHKLSYTDNVSQHQPLQSPLFSTSSKTSKTGCHQLSQAVAHEWLLHTVADIGLDVERSFQLQ